MDETQAKAGVKHVYLSPQKEKKKTCLRTLLLTLLADFLNQSNRWGKVQKEPILYITTNTDLVEVVDKYNLYYAWSRV